ncbi:MAG: YlcI/YnfO family protein [Cyanobacteria bacterium P01_A01_bin.135]
MKDSQPLRTLTIRLPDDVIAAIKASAASQNKSLSEFILEALRKAISEQPNA